jgi:GT2 family glycosyltransferase
MSSICQVIFIRSLLHFLESNPDVGIVGPRIRLLDGRLDQACRRSFKTPGIYLYKWTGISRLFPHSRRFGRYYLSYLDESEMADVDSVMGAFLLIRREALAAIGLLDEGFFMYSEDEDWCYRAKRAGWRVVYYPESVVWHLKGHSTRQHAVRMLAARHYSYLRFHRKNLAANYPAFVNGIVYAGILVGLGFALTKHIMLRAPR